jgi:hypothetical protein
VMTTRPTLARKSGIGRSSRFSVPWVETQV